MTPEKDYGPAAPLEEGEVYACQCGFRSTEKNVFGGHLLRAGREDGKGIHKSLGRVNTSGEVLYPPYLERTAEQKAETALAVGKEQKGKDGKGTRKLPPFARPTDNWEQATEFRVNPRIFNMDFTSIMRLAKVASIREWGWDEKMSWADFFDTCLHTFFKEHGITLAGYIVHEIQEEGAS